MTAAAGPGFKARSDAALADATLKIAIDRTTGTAERKRAAALAKFPEYDAARSRGRAIKDHVIANLDHYLEMFERNATASGAKVHSAATDMRPATSSSACAERPVRTSLTRSKSMLGEADRPA